MIILLHGVHRYPPSQLVVEPSRAGGQSLRTDWILGFLP